MYGGGIRCSALELAGSVVTILCAVAKILLM